MSAPNDSGEGPSHGEPKPADATTATASRPLLRVEGLSISFAGAGGDIRVLDDVGFAVERGRSVGLVGESGCGKSVTSLALLGLLPAGAHVRSGHVWFGGRDLLGVGERELRAVRGDRIAMVFQEPMTSLNPVYSVGWQIGESLRLHRRVSRRAARDRAIELLALVGIADPGARVDAYPHELSGGMRQRVMIAMALACEPDLLIADEPTTALDVTVQAQILELLKRLQVELEMGVLLVTHDLGVVAEFVDDVVVMYAGRVVETGPVHELLSRPRHPYTEGLMKSVPPLGAARGAAHRPARLPTIEGMVPSPADPPRGCRFEPRCGYARDRCREREPDLTPHDAPRRSRCYFADEVGAR